MLVLTNNFLVSEKENEIKNWCKLTSRPLNFNMIFNEQISRKPDYYPWTKDFIIAMWNGFWTPEKFTFQSDIQNFKTDLTEQEQTVVVNALSAIGQIEIAVKTFWANLGKTLPHPSILDMGLVMASVEVIHNYAYEKLLDVLQLEGVYKENLKLDIMIGRVQYLKKYNEQNYADKKKQFVYSLILFTLFVENVSLFSQFYIVLWFNTFQNVLKDTANMVGYTKNEETLHAMGGIKLIQTIRKEHPELFDDEFAIRIRHESVEAFKAESKIIDWMLGSYEGENLNAPVLKEYVKNRINQSLQDIGFETVFEIDQTLIAQSQWMDEIVMGNIASDFFHKHAVEYSKSHTSFDESDLF